MPPIISIILPVFNQEKYLHETIKSILGQTFCDFELIIADDGSTDDSANIIREFALNDNRIKAYFEPNAGKSKATAFLVNKAVSKWCAFLDADDVMLPNRLEVQLAFHIANPLIHASSSHCYYINEEGNKFGTQRYAGLSNINQLNEAVAGNQSITCSYTGLMVAKDVFIAVGGLRRQFEPCEDFDFFNRLIEKGFILLIIPEVLMHYRIHSAAITVKKPLLIMDTINYVEYCINLRREGEEEISFVEYNTIAASQSKFIKFNKRRFQYSMIYFRNAGSAMLSKKYISFIWQIATSFVLSPNYVMKKISNHLK